MVVCESVPTSESGKASLAVLLHAEDYAREVFEIYLVADAGIRRHDFEILKTLLSPAKKSVTLDIALHFEVGIESEASAAPNWSTCTEWSITSSAGSSGLIFLGSPPRLRIASRIAARSTTAGTPVKS